jgi:hypothetical protein
MTRADALYEFQEKVAEFAKFLDNDRPKSPVLLSDPTFSEQSISDAVDAVDSLRKWIDREVKKYEAFL